MSALSACFAWHICARGLRTKVRVMEPPDWRGHPSWLSSRATYNNNINNIDNQARIQDFSQSARNFCVRFLILTIFTQQNNKDKRLYDSFNFSYQLNYTFSRDATSRDDFVSPSAMKAR